MIRAEASTTIKRPIEEVFRYVTDPTNEPAWHTDVAMATRLSDGPIDVGSETSYTFGLSGGRGTAIGRVVDFEQDRLETIHYDRGPMGLTPTITLRFEPERDGVRFTRTVEIEPTGLARVLAPVMGRLVARRNATFVDNVRRRFAGDSPPS
ncbi:MAG: hypothetical protein QOF11_2109 [Chloroflexota bacterium]|jgi:uncharacterized protein YndB with AHSA1/START domain|nr:hypothetical protein [Chloroflexota bacterium]